ncbi:hypothetical protein [Brevundimonas pishanensis]|uniref:hypothetical protein n=1 Tax=Brevundimonas pishanensis TaxID=2896315 RepID=UPI001FA7193F|nr:hypothetical protein [Brevundimonas pishanensis]
MTEEQLALMKEQLAPVMSRMTRLQIFEMADFFYAQARERRSESSVEDWRFEISA